METKTMNSVKKLKTKIAAEVNKDFDFEQHLFKKYPSLFPTNEDGELLPQFERCWNDCPRGWETMVDNLFGCIDDYVRNTSRYVNDPSKRHIDFLIGVFRKIDKFLDRIKLNVSKKFYNRLFVYLRSKAQFIKQTPPSVKIAQYKEKFGSLRVYIDGGDEEVEGMIRFAEYLSTKTCQDTGEPGDLCKKGSWYSTLSPAKAEELGYTILKQ